MAVQGGGLLERAASQLLVVDIQVKLIPTIHAVEAMVARARFVIDAASALGVPITLTEQYPKGLGHTVPGLAAEIGNAPVFEKLAFSCWKDQPLKKHMIAHHEAGRPLVILAGIESHVCVMQTAADLSAAGFGVFAVADAMASRAPSSHALALERMRQHGVAVVNTEMVVFELLGKAGTAEFKALSALVR